MKKEQVLELMNAIPADLIEEADVQAPAKRRLPKPARMGLVAACLCLALLGTAFAAASYLGVRIQTDDDGVIWMSGGIAYCRHDALSDEIKAFAAEKDPAIRPCGSWQEAEDFIGVELMENPVLDASPATRYSHIFEGVEGRFLVITDSRLYNIITHGCFEIGDVFIDVECFLYTDRAQTDEDRRFFGISFLDEPQVSQTSYTAPSGLEAQLLEVDRPSGRYSIRGAFSLNGIPFVVKAHSDCGLDETHAALIQVLDGFVLPE